jgi:hypothetical protein
MPDEDKIEGYSTGHRRSDALYGLPYLQMTAYLAPDFEQEPAMLFHSANP